MLIHQDSVWGLISALAVAAGLLAGCGDSTGSRPGAASSASPSPSISTTREALSGTVSLRTEGFGYDVQSLNAVAGGVWVSVDDAAVYVNDELKVGPILRVKGRAQDSRLSPIGSGVVLSVTGDSDLDEGRLWITWFDKGRPDAPILVDGRHNYSAVNNGCSVALRGRIAWVALNEGNDPATLAKVGRHVGVELRRPLPYSRDNYRNGRCVASAADAFLLGQPHGLVQQRSWTTGAVLRVVDTQQFVQEALLNGLGRTYVTSNSRITAVDWRTGHTTSRTFKRHSIAISAGGPVVYSDEGGGADKGARIRLLSPRTLKPVAETTVFGGDSDGLSELAGSTDSHVLWGYWYEPGLIQRVEM